MRNEQKKKCGDCDKWKPTSSFYDDPSKTDGLQVYCKDCTKARVRAGRARRKDSEKTMVYAEPPSIPNSTRFSKYGLDKDLFTQMLIDQDYKCAICGSSIVEYQAIDHCHTTNKVRGLLCRLCNLGLGCFKDDPNLVDLAKSYLWSTSGKWSN